MHEITSLSFGSFRSWWSFKTGQALWSVISFLTHRTKWSLNVHIEIGFEHFHV